MVKRPRLKVIVFSVVLTVVFLLVLLTQVDFGRIVSALKGADRWLVVVGFFLYLLNAMLRTVRFRLFLVDKEGVGFQLFHVVTIQTMINNLIPNVLGEFSFVLLAKKLFGVSLVRSFASLVLSRMFDLIAVLVIFLCSVVFIENVPPLMEGVLLVFGFFVVFVLVFFYFLVTFKDQFLVGVQGLMALVRIEKWRASVYLVASIKNVVEAVSSVNSVARLVAGFVLSIVIWLVSLTLSGVLMYAAGYNLPLVKIVVGTIFSKITSLLPVYGLGGFGTTEGFWALGFMGLGIEKTIAVVTGFAVHIFSLTYTLILGLFSLLLMYRRFHTDQTEKEEDVSENVSQEVH